MSLIDQARSAATSRPAAIRPATSIGGLAGFTVATAGSRPTRLVVSVEALEKQGKTHFALTAPGDIAYHNFDLGLEGVVEKFVKGEVPGIPPKTIHIAHYPMPRIVGADPNIIAERAQETWGKFTADLDGSLSVPSIRTNVWDTATENYERLRLARFGKLTQVMPHHYGPVNSEYREQLRKVYDTDKNLILLHKLGHEWENYIDSQGREKGRKTGRYERKGFGDIGFAVQVIVRAYRDYDKEGTPFCLTVLDCRQNPTIIGETLEGATCSFPYLAALVYPETSPDDWM